MWEGLGRADRAESVAVARRLDRALADAGTGDAADSTWTAAALLHDVGKQASGYGPIGRSFVTAFGAFVGRDNVRAGRRSRAGSGDGWGGTSPTTTWAPIC